MAVVHRSLQCVGIRWSLKVASQQLDGAGCGLLFTDSSSLKIIAVEIWWYCSCSLELSLLELKVKTHVNANKKIEKGKGERTVCVV